MHSGSVSLVLHSHLPWAMNHGRWPHGEEWVYEAAAGSYLPLLDVFDQLVKANISPKITIGLSPVLCEQLDHPSFPEKFTEYIEEKIDFAEKDQERFKESGEDPHKIYLAGWWKEWYHNRLNDYKKKFNGSILGAFRKFQDDGHIEIMTCGLSHAYYPLVGEDQHIAQQIKFSVNNYQKHFGRKPRGTWIPECAYRPSYNWKSLIPVEPYHYGNHRYGVEELLNMFGPEYFFVDDKFVTESEYQGELDGSHKGGNHKSTLRIFNVRSKDSRTGRTSRVLARNRDLAMQVWSGEIGYPAHPNYLDFHKKQDRSMLRYWRVTDTKADMQYKDLYHPDWTWEKLDMQTNHFIHHLENTANYHHENNKEWASICLPFDTELFGHWWFEGPQFIKYLCEGIHHSPYLNMATVSEQIDKMNPQEIIAMPEGSWGENNDHSVWMNEDNKWTWEMIYNSERRMKDLMDNIDIKSINKELREVLTLALKSLHLMLASDWQFLITTWSARDYAEMRISNHHSDLDRLMFYAQKLLAKDKLTSDEKKDIKAIKERNSLFDEIKIEDYFCLNG